MTCDHIALKADANRWESGTIPPYGHTVRPVTEDEEVFLQWGTCKKCNSTLARPVKSKLGGSHDHTISNMGGTSVATAMSPRLKLIRTPESLPWDMDTQSFRRRNKTASFVIVYCITISALIATAVYFIR